MISAKKSERSAEWQHALLQRHQLSEDYLDSARAWFDPLAQKLSNYSARINRTMLVALNGCQGSGKTTVSDYLVNKLRNDYTLNAVALSLDDFYLTHRERQILANSVHPLFATRGVPGTHDMHLLQQTLRQLASATPGVVVDIPRFDKAADDRCPPADWDSTTAPVDIIFLEGWCLGATPQSTEALVQPLNALEREEDSTQVWRNYSNYILRRDFQPLYGIVDQWIMLSAPSFECVFNWRQEQERKLAAKTSAKRATKLLDDEALMRFIQHFERITRHCLAELPQGVHHLFNLNEQREVTAYTEHSNAVIAQ